MTAPADALPCIDCDVSCCCDDHYRPIYLNWMRECKDFVKAIRYELGCALLVFADLYILCRLQFLRVNTSQQPEIHSETILPGVSHSMYGTDVKKKSYLKGKKLFSEVLHNIGQVLSYE